MLLLTGLLHLIRSSRIDKSLELSVPWFRVCVSVAGHTKRGKALGADGTPLVAKMQLLVRRERVLKTRFRSDSEVPVPRTAGLMRVLNPVCGECI
jgi:hypothetical protein